MVEAPTESAAAHIVAQIDGAELPTKGEGRYRLAITQLQPLRQRVGWLYLAIALLGDEGVSRTPLANGIVSGGGRLVQPWFELRIYPTVELASGAIFDARGAGLEAALLDLIGTLTPPGGHVMIEYESPGQSATHAELLLQVPPAATHLGFLMFQAGFRGAFKDWYISEGGHEGPRKLQANKSPTPAAEQAALATHRAELATFLKRALPSNDGEAALIRDAQRRARLLLKEPQKSFTPGLARRGRRR